MFGYEIPFFALLLPASLCLQQVSIRLVVVYAFHSLLTHLRTFIFALASKIAYSIKTIVELFPNASWLERELSELYGCLFEGKDDTRNLLLPYGDPSSPFQKIYPVMGLRELFYLILLDIFKQSLVSPQT